MKKMLLAYILICLCNFSFCQKKRSKFSIGINPFSWGESLPSIGPCASYGGSSKFEIWAEASYIYSKGYVPTNWENLNGFRVIFQPRYYLDKSHTLFIAPEFRFKTFSYSSIWNFINNSTNDTIQNLRHNSVQKNWGGAIVIGKQFSISSNGKFYGEITAGIGAKNRNIYRQNIPAGYEYQNELRGHFSLPYNSDGAGGVYIPLAIRFMLKL